MTILWFCLFFFFAIVRVLSLHPVSHGRRRCRLQKVCSSNWNILNADMRFVPKWTISLLSSVSCGGDDGSSGDDELCINALAFWVVHCELRCNRCVVARMEQHQQQRQQQQKWIYIYMVEPRRMLMMMHSRNSHTDFLYDDVKCEWMNWMDTTEMVWIAMCLNDNDWRAMRPANAIFCKCISLLLFSSQTEQSTQTQRINREE